jgi:hypothetical protein
VIIVIIDGDPATFGTAASWLMAWYRSISGLAAWNGVLRLYNYHLVVIYMDVLFPEGRFYLTRS